MKVSREIIAALCRTYGKSLSLGHLDLDGAQLLWALAGNESNFGNFFPPRHEQGYCWKGRYFDFEQTKRWGCLAHCSWGPWQVMFPNCHEGVTPEELLVSLEHCADAAVRHLNLRVLPKCKTLEEIADAYNSGSPRDNNIPTTYIARLVANYSVPMP